MPYCSLSLSLLSPELMTLVSESCSQALVSADCLPVLLELVAQTNRSQAALVVVAGIMRILSNISKVLRVCYDMACTHLC